MSTWAVLAAKQAAIATGFGAGLVPAIGTGSLDGFVIGAAMTGACFTALTAPGRARRRAGGTAAVVLPATAAGVTAATSAAGVTAASANGAEDADSARAALLRRYFAAAEQFEPAWERPSPAAEHAAGQDQGDSRPEDNGGDWAQDGPGGYQSRHRLGDGSPIRRPRQEGRRAAPKHAAPPSSLASRLTGVFAGRAVLSAARH
jgi:hypothetical protein